MQHQVLAAPAHQGIEHDEDGHGDADGNQRALGAVHHHLVDDGLGEQRRCERDHLQRQAGQQHVSPNAAVPQQLRGEPFEAKGLGDGAGWRIGRTRRVGIVGGFDFGGKQPALAGEQSIESGQSFLLNRRTY